MCMLLYPSTLMISRNNNHNLQFLPKPHHLLLLNLLLQKQNNHLHLSLVLLDKSRLNNLQLPTKIKTKIMFQSHQNSMNWTKMETHLFWKVLL